MELTPTKALSGYAEYFYCLAMNWKPVENRNWPLTRFFRRSQLPIRIYLHASKTKGTREDKLFIQSYLLPNQWQEFMEVDWDRIRGCIIGEITLTDEVTDDDIGLPAVQSPWFFGPYGFVCEDGILYDKPIPCRGRTFFFKPEV